MKIFAQALLNELIVLFFGVKKCDGCKRFWCRSSSIKTTKTLSSNIIVVLVQIFIWQSGFDVLNWYFHVFFHFILFKILDFPMFRLKTIDNKIKGCRSWTASIQFYNIPNYTIYPMFGYYFTYFHDSLEQKITNQVWRTLRRVVSKKLFVETIMDKVFKTMVFMWNSKLWGKFNFSFPGVFW